jgi:hypothetical protein
VLWPCFANILFCGTEVIARDSKCFSFHFFLFIKGVIANGACHERIVNIKYWICRDYGIGYEDT